MNNLQKLKTKRKKWERISSNLTYFLVILFLAFINLLILTFDLVICVDIVLSAIIIIIIMIIAILIFTIVEIRIKKTEVVIKEYFFGLPKNKKIKEDYEKIIEEYKKFLEN